MNQALMSSSLAPIIEQWARLNTKLRRCGLGAVTIIAVLGFCWLQADANEVQPLPKPLADEPVALLEPLSLATLHELAEQWTDVAISRQQERYSLQMRLNWAQLYQFAATLSASAHHPESYRVQWPESAYSNANGTGTDFALTMQLQPGRYRRSAPGFQWVDIAAEVAKPQLNCATPPLPSIEVMAIWPSRDTVQLQTKHGSLRLKAQQLLDNTWLLSVIKRDLLQFSWQPPDARCPVEVITVAI